jgi:hypothetical protein
VSPWLPWSLRALCCVSPGVMARPVHVG